MGEADFDGEDRDALTTNSGEAVPTTRTPERRAPRAVADAGLPLFEKMAHFNRERVPERVVHAKGDGAYGTFTVTNDVISEYSKAALFSEVGKQTQMLARFSTVGGENALGRHRARPARLRAEVLHRGGQLGHGRQQHADLLHPRPPRSSPTSSTPRSASPGATSSRT